MRTGTRSRREKRHVASKAIVGEKVGMTQVWDDQNRAVPVTVLKVAPVRVVQVKTPETDGYSALQVTWGFRRNSTLTKPQLGHYAKAGVNPGRGLVELRLDDVADFAVGQELAADLWEAGERVDAIAVSKGKGFAGGMKRHNFKGQGASHGNHRSHRVPGLHRRLRHAVARLQGHPHGRARWAATQVTALNLEVVSADAGARAGPGQGRRARGPGQRRGAAQLGQGAEQGREGRDDDDRDGTASARAPCSPHHAKERPPPVTRTVTRRNAAGHDLGSVELEPTIFGLEPNRAVLHQVVTAQLAASPGRHPVDQDQGRGPRRRRQAVPPEGHRPGPSGLEPLAVHERRWRRPRARSRAATHSAPRRRWSAWPCSRPSATGPTSGGSPSSTTGRSRSPGPRTPSPFCASSSSTGTVLVVWPHDELDVERSFANLPEAQTTTFAELSAHDILRADWLLFSDRTLPTAVSDFSGTHVVRAGGRRGRGGRRARRPRPTRQPTAAKATKAATEAAARRPEPTDDERPRRAAEPTDAAAEDGTEEADADA